jgi:hypothetical protein
MECAHTGGLAQLEKWLRRGLVFLRDITQQKHHISKKSEKNE